MAKNKLTVRFTVDIPYELWEKLTYKTMSLGRSKKEIMADLILAYVSEK